MNYYHGTSDWYLERIKKQGLRPSPGKYWDEVFADSIKRIAMAYAQLTVDRIGGNPIIVTIESSRVPESLITKHSEDDLFAKYIPPEAIVDISYIKRE